jgi:hypothetical protein
MTRLKCLEQASSTIVLGDKFQIMSEYKTKRHEKSIRMNPTLYVGGTAPKIGAGNEYGTNYRC